MIRHLIDEDARRVIVRIDEHSTGAQSASLTLQLAQARPELFDWDWVYDVRAARGQVSNDDVARTAQAFNAHQTRHAYTIFVTMDAHFGLWAKVMDHQFQKRSHLSSGTLEDALERLDRLRAAQESDPVSRAPSSSGK